MSRHALPQVPHDPKSQDLPACTYCTERSWERKHEECSEFFLDEGYECRLCGTTMRLIVPHKSFYGYFLFYVGGTPVARECESYISFLSQKRELMDTVILPRSRKIAPKKNLLMAWRKPVLDELQRQKVAG